MHLSGGVGKDGLRHGGPEGQDKRVRLVWFQRALCCGSLGTEGKTILPPARDHGDFVSIGIAWLVVTGPNS